MVFSHVGFTKEHGGPLFTIIIIYIYTQSEVGSYNSLGAEGVRREALSIADVISGGARAKNVSVSHIYLCTYNLHTYEQ